MIECNHELVFVGHRTHLQSKVPVDRMLVNLIMLMVITKSRNFSSTWILTRVCEINIGEGSLLIFH